MTRVWIVREYDYEGATEYEAVCSSPEKAAAVRREHIEAEVEGARLDIEHVQASRWVSNPTPIEDRLAHRRKKLERDTVISEHEVLS